MSFKPEVVADSTGEWYGNALRFATEQEARDNVRDLASRWFAVRETRVVESADPVNYSYIAGQLIPVETPQFTHDCERCKFLGRFHQEDHCNSTKNFDLYWCPQYGAVATLIARFSNDGPDYMSGLEFGRPGQRVTDTEGNEIPERNLPTFPLRVAYDRAAKLGLIPADCD